jgi:RNA polymerase sigma factor (TIGR02999 family)
VPDDKTPPACAVASARGALDGAFAALYPELRKIARGCLRGRDPSGAGLDATTLVHEAFLRLVDAPGVDPADRKHFYTYAAKTMRHIVIDAARQRRAAGGTAPSLDDDAVAAGAEGVGHDAPGRINDALLALEAVDAGLARIVELRYFAGHGEAEIAALLGTSERTVRRRWREARAFLLASLR